MTMKSPPTIGVGMVTKTAPNLQKRPKRIMMSAAHWMTRRLPTWHRNRINKYKDSLVIFLSGLDTFVTPIAPIFSE